MVGVLQLALGADTHGPNTPFAQNLLRMLNQFVVHFFESPFFLTEDP